VPADTRRDWSASRLPPSRFHERRLTRARIRQKSDKTARYFDTLRHDARLLTNLHQRPAGKRRCKNQDVIHRTPQQCLQNRSPGRRRPDRQHRPRPTNSLNLPSDVRCINTLIPTQSPATACSRSGGVPSDDRTGIRAGRRLSKSLIRRTRHHSLRPAPCDWLPRLDQSVPDLQTFLKLGKVAELLFSLMKLFFDFKVFRL
jgi:hypothetical protein